MRTNVLAIVWPIVVWPLIVWPPDEPDQYSGEAKLKKGQALSKGELEIARALWEIGPATVRAIYQRVCESRDIDFTTVQTYLRRLESKGYANSKLDGRVRVYAAKTKRQTVIRDTVEDLVNRLFGGSAMPLVRHLIEERNISRDEIAELREVIDRLETRQESHDTEADESQQEPSA